jgi:NADH:ubiquinone oxidoreductase subunit K
VSITLDHYLVLGAVLFAIGLFGALSRRGLVAILLCIELMLNAVNITFVAFSRYLSVSGQGQQVATGQLTGQIFALFIIAVAAAEAAVALAITLAVYRTRRTTSIEDISLMKW